MNKNNLPLRVGVGVIVLNKENKIFVGKRKDNAVDKWQMPQGGVEKNENFLCHVYFLLRGGRGDIVIWILGGPPRSQIPFRS